VTPFTYRFRPLSISDLPLVGQWLSHPHVADWWGDPVPALAAIKDHLADPAMNLFIVSFGDMPIGYQQSYDPHAEPDHPLHDPPNQFIGEPALIGRGHGSAFIRAFVEQSFAAGVPRVVTDPNPRNSRAIRAYAKAGFYPIGQRRTLSGEALLMGCDAPAKATKEMSEMANPLTAGLCEFDRRTGRHEPHHG
jgi:aminoglycoside 6'-N-acetyltransferase